MIGMEVVLTYLCVRQNSNTGKCSGPLSEKVWFIVSLCNCHVCFYLFRQHGNGSRHSTASAASEESENEQSNGVNEQETLAGEN